MIKKYYMIANYGDDSIAALQWLHVNKIENVTALSVDTHWASKSWSFRVSKAQDWLHSIGFETILLTAKAGFSDIVSARRQFPNKEFNWCSSHIKGITLLNFLEENDPGLESCIVLSHRRDMSIKFNKLDEYIQENEYYDDRRSWQPLYKHSQAERDQLIHDTPFKTPLNHRSLECQPCIYQSRKDQNIISKSEIERIATLEKKIKKSMFDKSFDVYSSNNDRIYYDYFSESCGWDYSCGL